MKPEKQSQYSERYTQAVQKFLASPEADIEFSREVYWQLRAEFCDLQKKIGRWALYSAVFVCIFELLNRRLIGGGSFLGIQVDRLTFLAYFLPPAVAFCIAVILTVGSEQLHYGFLMIAFAKQKFPGLYASQISLLLTSSTGMLSSDVPAAFTTRIGKFNNSLFLGVQYVLLIIGWLIFEIYAYTELFRHSKHFNGAAFVSLLVTASFITVIVLRIIEGLSDPTPPSRDA